MHSARLFRFSPPQSYSNPKRRRCLYLATIALKTVFNSKYSGAASAVWPQNAPSGAASEHGEAMIIDGSDSLNAKYPRIKGLTPSECLVCVCSSFYLQNRKGRSLLFRPHRFTFTIGRFAQTFDSVYASNRFSAPTAILHEWRELSSVSFELGSMRRKHRHTTTQIAT